MPFPFFFDTTYVLIIIGLVISLLAQVYVKNTFAKYSNDNNQHGFTATEVASLILERAGIHDVRVERVRGELTDHYDSRAKVLRLSDATANSRSVAAIGVAAHEAGHAIQDQESYVPLRLRAGLVPAASFGQAISIPMLLIGSFLGAGGQTLITLGILLFSLTFVFQVVTLPVEFNASRRALQILDEGILTEQEMPKAQKVLTAAALTYIAAAIMSFLQLLRLILIFGGRSRD